MAAKVALVQDVQGEVPLVAALRAVGLARSTWHYRVRYWQPYEARYAGLRVPLERIARAHPEYGYRRATTELQEVHGQAVTENVVRRLHRLWELPLLRGTRVPRPRNAR